MEKEICRTQDGKFEGYDDFNNDKEVISYREEKLLVYDKKLADEHKNIYYKDLNGKTIKAEPGPALASGGSVDGKDEYLKNTYPLIEKLCEAGTAMQQATGISDNSAGFISETKRLQDSLVTDYYGILVGVLVKHKVISYVKEFIKSVN